MYTSPGFSAKWLQAGGHCPYQWRGVTQGMLPGQRTPRLREETWCLGNWVSSPFAAGFKGCSTFWLDGPSCAIIDRLPAAAARAIVSLGRQGGAGKSMGPMGPMGPGRRPGARPKEEEKLDPRRPRVVLGDKGRERMTRGADRLAHLLGLTLGPVGGHVLSTKTSTVEPCETLTDAATIARRMIAFPEMTEDVGAMLMRQLVWRVRQKVGDGSATAAVLARAMLREARRTIAAGANPMMVRNGIQLGVQAAVKALRDMAESLEGQERLAALATAACGDPDLGRVVGEIFDTIGPEGIINVQDYIGDYLDRSYIEGSRFKGTFTSRFFLTDVNHRLVQMVRPYIFITDWNLSDAAQVQPVMELVLRQEEKRPLLVISSSQDGAALATMLANHQKQVLQCCGVTLKGVGDPMRAALDDIALITGGRFLYKAAGLSGMQVTLADLGQAQRVEVDEDHITFFEGAGDRKAVRQRRQSLRASLEDAKNEEEAAEIRERLGRLASGIAVLKVGAVTEKDRKLRREQAEQAVKVVAAGYKDGVAPGGGAAYLACIPAVLAVPAEGDVAYGLNVVARALEEPMRQLATNAALEASAMVARAKAAGDGYGLEVRSERIVDMRQAGIMDSVRVLQTALEAAASGAIMVLTTGAVIHHRKPDVSVEP
ncbi:MAG: chaperonin GroEL [Anaerolineae bacterium]